MSTIQTQINLVHLQAGLAVPAVTQRTTVGSQFASNAIEVTTTAETIPLGDVTTPKQVMIKFISGDPVRIGLDYGTDGVKYPFRLSAADEGGLLPLDVEGLVETSTLTFSPAAAGFLVGAYFTLEGRSGTWTVWYDPGDGGEPTPVTGTAKFLRIPDVSLAGNTADELATETYAAMTSSLTDFTDDFVVTRIPLSNILSIVDKHSGSRANLNAGTSGFTANTTQQGAPSPTIHLKSLGTSQVVVAVAPY